MSAFENVEEIMDETGWFNHLRCNNDFGSILATHKAIKLIEELYCEEAKTYYLDKYFHCTGQKTYAAQPRVAES